MMAAAQLFVGDAPLVRALAVAAMVAMHVAPATAEETEMVWTKEVTGLAAGWADKTYVPNKRCVANFREASETEEQNEGKFGVVQYYEQSFCKGEDRIVTERFAAHDTTCEGDVVQTTERRTSDTKDVQVGYSATKCYFGSTDGTCSAAATDTNKASCAGMVTMMGDRVTADNCAATGCYTYIQYEYSTTSGNGCPANSGECVDGDTQVTCTATMAKESNTCVAAPAGLGTLILKSYSNSACTEQCAEKEYTTGFCRAYGENSWMYTASAETASFAYYTKDDGSALACADANKMKQGDEYAPTPVGQCLSSKDYPDAKSSFNGDCESSTDDTWFKLEYVAGEGEAESSAAGLTLLSVASMATGLALVTQLIM